MNQNQGILPGFPGRYVCERCNRPLKNPESVARGLGPICAGKSVLEAEQLDESGQSELLPVHITQGLVLERKENNEIATNVPRVAISHSPDGFQFGYAGSGPSDLALNAVELILTQLGYEGPRTKCAVSGNVFLESFNIYQDFKLKFIAAAGDEGARYQWQEIRDFVIRHLSPEGQAWWRRKRVHK